MSITGTMLPWKQSEFQEEYVEILSERDLMERAATKLLRAANAGESLLARQAYEEFEGHRKAANRKLINLSLRFRRNIAERKALLKDWTREDSKNNELLCALEKTMNAVADALLTVHRFTLLELQINSFKN